MRFVRDFYERAGIGCLVKRGGNHQRNRLTRVMNLVILKRQVGLPLRVQVAPRHRVHARHVFVGEHDEHARCVFGSSGVDRHGPAICDRAIDDCGVGYGCERNICRVACTSGHLEPAVDA